MPGSPRFQINETFNTSPLISQVIEEEFGVQHHPGHVRKMLKQMGYSRQRPTTRLVQADPLQKRKWVRYTYPKLKNFCLLLVESWTPGNCRGRDADAR